MEQVIKSIKEYAVVVRATQSDGSGDYYTIITRGMDREDATINMWMDIQKGRHKDLHMYAGNLDVQSMRFINILN